MVDEGEKRYALFQQKCLQALYGAVERMATGHALNPFVHKKHLAD
jgi:hypothetical protein